MKISNALFEASLRVSPDWIDLNGHMHDANYLDAFNAGIGELFAELRVGVLFGSEGHAIFNLGFNVDFIKELFVGEPIRVTMQIVDWDRKRVHIYAELRHGETDELCATAERLFMNISTVTRRSAPFADEAYERIATLGNAHAAFGKPARLGRTLGIRRAELFTDKAL